MSDLLRQSGSAWYGSGTSGGTPGGSNTQIQYNSSGSFAGSSSLTWDGSTFTITGALNADAGSGAAYVASTGTVAIGDALGNGTGTKIIVDDSGQTIDLITVVKSVSIGDVNGGGSGTTLVVDTANSRATFNKKAVITDTGSFYIYDSGTSTYWKWESISGVWTGTDTGSASLP